MAFEEVAFEVGRVSIGAARALALAVGLYGLGTMWYAWKAFHALLADRWSALLSSVVLLVLAMVLWARGAELVPAPFSSMLVLVWAAWIVFTLTFTLGRYQDQIDRFRELFGERLDTLLKRVLPEDRYTELGRLRTQWSKSGNDEQRRKMPHLLMGVFLVFYVGLGYLILKGLWDLAYGTEGSEIAGEGVVNLYEATHNGVLAAGHMFGITALFFLLFALAPTELLRLRYPELSYPFKQLILTRLREKERGLFGAHLYITATLPLAVLWLARDPAHWDRTLYAVMAVYAVTVFADAASALFGIRYGKRKLPHNKGKSYIGSLAGTAVAILITIPFVGLPMAIISGAVFMIVDILAPVPFPISDNILNPLGLALAYNLGMDHLAPMLPYF